MARLVCFLMKSMAAVYLLGRGFGDLRSLMADDQIAPLSCSLSALCWCPEVIRCIFATALSTSVEVGFKEKFKPSDRTLRTFSSTCWPERLSTFEGSVISDHLHDLIRDCSFLLRFSFVCCTRVSAVLQAIPYRDLNCATGKCLWYSTLALLTAANTSPVSIPCFKIRSRSTNLCWSGNGRPKTLSPLGIERGRTCSAKQSFRKKCLALCSWAVVRLTIKCL